MNDWIPRLLSEEENSKDSWRPFRKYLPYKFGGLNYLTSFLQASIYPSSTKNSFSIFLELKTTCNVISHQEFALFNTEQRHIVQNGCSIYKYCFKKGIYLIQDLLDINAITSYLIQNLTRNIF